MSALTDPQPGQIVESEDRKRRYVDRLALNLVFYRRTEEGPITCCFIETWQDWCRKNKAKEVNGV